jgi:hypothetical protein
MREIFGRGGAGSNVLWPALRPRIRPARLLAYCATSLECIEVHTGALLHFLRHGCGCVSLEVRRFGESDNSSSVVVVRLARYALSDIPAVDT